VPYVSSSRFSRKHALMRHFRKRFARVVLFIVVIIVATVALNFIFKLGDYFPGSTKSMEDRQREDLMKKFEEAGKKAGQIPPQPSRR
jgi:hypothetical protein